MGRGDRISRMFNCQKACEKVAHVHAQIAGLPMICKQQLEPAQINVPR